MAAAWTLVVAWAAAAQPLATLLPDTTVLAVEVAPGNADATTLEALFADLVDPAAAGAVAAFAELVASGVPGGPASPHLPARRDLHAEFTEACPELAGELGELADGDSWSAALGVTLSRANPRPGALAALLPGSRAQSARLLAALVACFDGRRHGDQDTTAIYRLSTPTSDPFFAAAQGGLLLAATDPDLLRAGLRRAAGSGERSLADTRVGRYAAQLEPSAIAITLNATALADLVPGNAARGGQAGVARLAERAKTTLLALGGVAIGITVDDGGVLAQAVSPWDAALAAAAGEHELLALLGCGGCSLGRAPYLPASAESVVAGALRPAALEAWVDSWLADASAAGLFGGEVVTLRGAAAESLGLDLGAALVDWPAGAWYRVTTGVLGTDLRDWVLGPPTLTAVPVASEAAARRAVDLWLAALADLRRAARAAPWARSPAGAALVDGGLSVREASHGGVDYLRVRAAPSLDVGIAVAHGHLLLGTPTASLLAALDEWPTSPAPAGRVARALESVHSAPGDVVGYSVVDVRSLLDGAAAVVDLASGPVAGAIWLGAVSLADAAERHAVRYPAGGSAEQAATPTYDDALRVMDAVVAALETLASRTSVAVGTVSVHDDARWAAWRLELSGRGR